MSGRLAKEQLPYQWYARPAGGDRSASARNRVRRRPARRADLTLHVSRPSFAGTAARATAPVDGVTGTHRRTCESQDAARDCGPNPGSSSSRPSGLERS